MSNIALTDTEQLSGASGFLLGIFQQLVASIALVLDKEHYGDGAHKDVTADTATVGVLKFARTYGPSSTKGVISPPTIVAATNNYNPQGLATAGILRLVTDASRNISGLAAPTDRTHFTLRILINAGGQNIVLLHQNTASDPANRFHIGNTTSVTLIGGDWALLLYDPIIERWRAGRLTQ